MDAENSNISNASADDYAAGDAPVLNPKVSANPYFSAIGAASVIVFCLTVFTVLSADRVRDLYLSMIPVKEAAVFNETPDAKQIARQLNELKRTVAAQKRRLAGLTPRSKYLIINTSENRIMLMQGDRLIHEGLCSTGSYTVLKTHDDNEMWVFQTPRGMLRVQNKIVNPVWRMPDWAFIEEGLPVPPPYAAERFERNVLGDYALDLGDGYLIHGTLYQRFLGMPVTHGCVRLGDDELKIVYDNLTVGSRVYIY